MNYAFNVDIANIVGVEKAVLIENIAFWIKKNKANGRNEREGRFWTYNSSRAFAELFPFWTTSKIQRMLRTLEEDRYILSGTYNKVQYDRTKWYTITDEYIESLYGLNDAIVQNCTMENAKSTNGLSNNNQTIPYINTNNKPDIKKEKNEQPKLFDDPGEKTDTPPTPKTIPVEEIVSIWNSMMVGLPKIKVIGKTIRPKIEERWKDNKDFQTLEAWQDLFIYILESDFLTGKSSADKPFKVSLDWVCGSTNWEKILNGKYIPSGMAYEDVIREAKDRKRRVHNSLNMANILAVIKDTPKGQ